MIPVFIHHDARNAIFRFAQDLDRLLGSRFGIPDPYGGIEGAGDEHGVICAAEANCVNSGAVAFIAAESLDCFSCCDVPKEDGTVPANGGEAGVVSVASQLANLIF
jgi:hypothetical protein